MILNTELVGNFDHDKDSTHVIPITDPRVFKLRTVPTHRDKKQ